MKITPGADINAWTELPPGGTEHSSRISGGGGSSNDIEIEVKVAGPKGDGAGAGSATSDSDDPAGGLGEKRPRSRIKITPAMAITSSEFCFVLFCLLPSLVLLTVWLPKLLAYQRTFKVSLLIARRIPNLRVRAARLRHVRGSCGFHDVVGDDRDGRTPSIPTAEIKAGRDSFKDGRRRKRMSIGELEVHAAETVPRAQDITQYSNLVVFIVTLGAFGPSQTRFQGEADSSAKKWPLLGVVLALKSSTPCSCTSFDVTCSCTPFDVTPLSAIEQGPTTTILL